MKLRNAVILVVMLLVPRFARAHDFWMEPSSYRPRVGDLLTLDLRVGEFFEGEPSPRRASRVVAFVLAGPTEVADVGGGEGDVPAGTVVVHEPGGLLAGYRSNPSAIELPAEKFEHYLREEGLEHVIERRAAAGASARPGRESYSRCAKALVSTPDAVDSLHDALLGFPLEILAEQDPRELSAGDELSVRVLLDDAPAAGLLVVATPARDHEICERGRTSEDGSVRLRLGVEGPWLVRCVAMRPASPSVAADWESLWSSLTFSVGR